MPRPIAVDDGQMAPANTHARSITLRRGIRRRYLAVESHRADAGLQNDVVSTSAYYRHTAKPACRGRVVAPTRSRPRSRGRVGISR